MPRQEILSALVFGNLLFKLPRSEIDLPMQEPNPDKRRQKENGESPDQHERPSQRKPRRKFKERNVRWVAQAQSKIRQTFAKFSVGERFHLAYPGHPHMRAIGDVEIRVASDWQNRAKCFEPGLNVEDKELSGDFRCPARCPQE